MVKKRCVRTPNKVKHEDPPASAEGREIRESRRDVARDHFKGVLHSVLLDQSSNSSSDSSQDEEPASPLSPPIKTPIKRESRITRRRKKKTTTEVDQQFHHTFVMKLFDRSVDLAQFSEDTPLYPICRGWMANTPRSTYNVTASYVKNEIKEEEEDDEEIKSKYVYLLPKPEGPVLSRIPSPEHVPLVGITEKTFEMNTKKITLLQEHMERWTKVRRKWITAAQDNEARYAESGKIISEIFTR